MNTLLGGDEFLIDLNIDPTETPLWSPPSPLSLSWSPLLLSDTPLSCPFLFDINDLPPLLPLLPPDTPSSGRHLFSPPLPPGPPPLLLPTLRLSPSPVLLEHPSWDEGEEWDRPHSYQASPWRNTEEERWSSIQASQRQEPEPRQNEEPGQTTLTECQIWEALDKLKNQKYIGEACAICLEYFVPEETVSITPCKHMFHKKCLVPWVVQKGQCPHCRFFLFEATRNRW